MTYVVGKRSNLSRSIAAASEHIRLLSAEDVLSGGLCAKDGDTIVLNNFQKATMLNDISQPISYIKDSILATAYVLDALIGVNVARIIYTSSASVYGNNIYCREVDTLEPLSIHASLKVANEKLIERFCNENGIDFTVTRVFNMYGGDDQFSVVSKLLNCIKNGDEFTLVNNGNAIRDFVHIEDVTRVYQKLIHSGGPRYLNVASGVGTSIGQMIDFLRLKGITLKTKVVYRDELKVSTASTELLSTVIDISSFKNVYDFVKGV